jgi:uncharacterized membrane protein (Fun14 family)
MSEMTDLEIRDEISTLVPKWTEEFEATEVKTPDPQHELHTRGLNCFFVLALIAVLTWSAQALCAIDIHTLSPDICKSEHMFPFLAFAMLVAVLACIPNFRVGWILAFAALFCVDQLDQGMKVFLVLIVLYISPIVYLLRIEHCSADTEKTKALKDKIEQYMLARGADEHSINYQLLLYDNNRNTAMVQQDAPGLDVGLNVAVGWAKAKVSRKDCGLNLFLVCYSVCFLVIFVVAVFIVPIMTFLSSTGSGLIKGCVNLGLGGWKFFHGLFFHADEVAKTGVGIVKIPEAILRYFGSLFPHW